MHLAIHQLCDGRIDLPVAGHRRHAPECLSDDMHAKMTKAARSTRMAGVQVALVLDDELLRREALRQDLAQARGPLAAVHGSTARKGSTSTRSNTPAAT